VPADYVNLRLSETCNNSLMGSDGASVWMCWHALAGAEIDTLRRASSSRQSMTTRKRPAAQWDAMLSQTKL
jgi:hypothetical protein